MATGPIDYSIDVQTPFQSALQGYQAGAAIRNDQFQFQQQQRAAEQQRLMQTDLAALYANPSPRAIAQLSLKYPQLSEQFKRSNDMLNEQQRTSMISTATPIYAAVLSGRNDIAATQVRDLATAMENSGQADDAKHTRVIADLIEKSPETARISVGAWLSSLMGPEKFGETFGKLGEEQRATGKAPLEQAKLAADVDNTRSQIDERAARLALDRDKLTSEVELKLYELGQKSGELNDGARKLINDATIDAVSSDQAAAQMLSLADQFEKLGGGYGGLGSLAEAWARVTGSQDAMSRARQEYVRLRNSEAVKSLPPGPATDKDIELALKGFPPENADAAYVASFLRGQAKLQQRNAVLQSAKVEWINSVGSLAKPKKDIEVDGIKVPAGSTFTDFARQFIDKKTEERVKSDALNRVKDRSYMRFGGATGEW